MSVSDCYRTRVLRRHRGFGNGRQAMYEYLLAAGGRLGWVSGATKRASLRIRIRLALGPVITYVSQAKSFFAAFLSTTDFPPVVVWGGLFTERVTASLYVC